ncbi:VCBS repeat-containing protein [Polyangium sp. 15x6]|uniref:FG-GAP repeat domain-containing protein n=1 Tax=Polyangium sp. 15x6 TaxID=3042687 RepID=UPI00249C173B|nr:VCBS repeat-containing protein [Polyangium sp. 15x6]MDI3283294.1 VCBS repeat-containing protein [Polyangium sp. 15x6]
MKMRGTMRFAALGLLAGGMVFACGGGGGTAPTGTNAGGSGGTGGGNTGGTGGDAGSGGDVFTDAGCPPALICGDTCCPTGETCALGTTCAREQPACVTNDDCLFDSYCDAGQCIPYGIPGAQNNDPSCTSPVEIGAIVPSEQCRWTGPPDGDAHPNSFHVMATPVVVDFDFDSDPNTLSPSVVFSSFPTAGSYSNPGVLRVISGKDCSQQFSFDDAADATMAPASVAAGDLDGDGRAEIVAARHGGGVIAFKFDPASNKFSQLWRSGTCPGGSGPPTTLDTAGGTDKWSGPSIHDLDDDGKPEIIYGATVYRADGCMASNSLGFPAYSKGVVPVVADVDEDGKMELVLGNGIHQWDAVAGDWVAEAYFTPGNLAAGQVAVAELGSFPLDAFGGQDRAEVVVVSAGTIRVQTLAGTVVFGPITIPGGGTGGPPTIADFDGDGRREFASAGGTQYVVFDFDCLAGGDAAKCGGQSPGTGILWSQPSKDASSNVTGSSVFDFDYDGKAEAVYADECFLRVYDGSTGTVIYSVARTSGTTYENPVIVDVDGDYHTEIVTAVNDYANLNCPATDPIFPAATSQNNHGILILRDEQERWAASRPVWNQHAYAVTHVGNHGEIPKTSSVAINWKDATLNNFRQNVQGDLEALGQPDLTAGGDVGAVKCVGTLATIEARVCNRGTLPMVSGTEVTFYDGSAEGPTLCTAAIPVALGVSECTIVSCQADLGGKKLDIYVRVDPQTQTLECHEKNNDALYTGVECGAVPN